MKLQEEQWDNLFDCNAASNVVTSAANCVTPTNHNPKRSPPGTRKSPCVSGVDLTIEQAQAVAKAKLAANGGMHTQPQPKRKRATPDDIFRSKKNMSP
eukprot:CAMPEP_0198150072 /NCGR_PEP_ID=MMETSP1443-20131203/49278_1 /TAXON_ID=186043 /ORGANISM="Entomoneis sp., Strain CCMP2396" /LENGTH=97 /DNA_ID=CAMNT_0043815275 /DNA_START=1 /DNA_END=290 /DNA_ORIENTATION=-